MKLYYDRINKKQTGIFRNEDETIINTDARVSCFWQKLEPNQDRLFDVDGFPYIKTYAVKPDGSRYSNYLDTPDANGIYQPDTTQNLINEYDTLINDKYAYIRNEYSRRINDLVKNVTNEEKATWEKQEAEARAYTADNTIATPFIDGMIDTWGETKENAVNRILTKANALIVLSAPLLGIKNKLDDQIKNIIINNTDGDGNIDYETIIDTVSEITWP